MIALKKYIKYPLFSLIIASFASLLQGSEDNGLTRRWRSISEMGTKILQCPYTYYAAAPLTLYAGYKLAKTPIKYCTKYLLEKNTFAGSLVGGAAVFAYYAPTFALTELMRKQRASVTESDRPSKWHLFGPTLVQSLIIAGVLWPQNPISATLFVSLFLNPGITTGTRAWACECDTDSQAFNERMRERNTQIRALREHNSELQRNNEMRHLNILRRIQEIEQLRTEIAQLSQARRLENDQVQANINESAPSTAWQQEELQRIEEENRKLQNQQQQLQEGLQEEDICSICLSSMEEESLTTVCNHTFHQHCLNTWLAQHNDCPLCRTSIVQ